LIEIVKLLFLSISLDGCTQLTLVLVAQSTPTKFSFLIASHLFVSLFQPESHLNIEIQNLPISCFFWFY